MTAALTAPTSTCAAGPTCPRSWWRAPSSRTRATPTCSSSRGTAAASPRRSPPASTPGWRARRTASASPESSPAPRPNSPTRSRAPTSRTARPRVVIARADRAAEVPGVAGLATRLGAPLLWTEPGGPSASTATELARLAPQQLVLAGVDGSFDATSVAALCAASGVPTSACGRHRRSDARCGLRRASPASWGCPRAGTCCSSGPATPERRSRRPPSRQPRACRCFSPPRRRSVPTREAGSRRIVPRPSARSPRAGRARSRPPR